MTGDLRWRDVSRREPCPICSRDSWCSLSDPARYVLCRRQSLGGTERTDTNGAPYFLHRTDGWRPRERAADTEPQPGANRAPAATLTRVYGALLSEMELSTAHRENLRERGLSDDEVDRRGYQTLPVRGRAALAWSLIQQFDPPTCARVPGLYVREEDGRRWWSLAGSPGLLIPVRDLAGRVIALRVRADNPGEGRPRYSWVSSRSRGGPGPGAQAHVPLWNGDTRTVRVTEGELKADLASVLSGILTLSLPGAALIAPVLPILRELRPERVLLALDADARTNAHVARALQSDWSALEALACR